jgi:hypothetical protein
MRSATDRHVAKQTCDASERIAQVLYELAAVGGGTL